MEGLSILFGKSKESWPDALTHFKSEAVGPALSDFQRPVRLEGDIFNIEVEGAIPKEIAGTFYRIMPDPAFPPYIKDDIWINGDGVVSAFRIKDGHVDFKQRFVNTEKLIEEKKHRRALTGRYRNPFTDLVNFSTRTVSNTTVFAWRDKMLALKEDGPPYAMDPKTLETHGVYDFEGQWDSETFTAHPKYDAVTRELLCFGYEAKGLGTKDNLYASFNQNGILTEKVWFQAPVCGFQHEMAATENWVIFPIIPMICDVERMKKGGNHWQWHPEMPYYIGVMPRRGAKPSDVKWFYGDNAYQGHIANAWEENGKINIYMSHTAGNVFTFWPDKEGNSPPIGTHPQLLARWEIDPHSEELHLEKPEIIIQEDSEFYRVDDRFMCHKSRYIYGIMLDKAEGKTNWKLMNERIGGGFPPFNTIYIKDLQAGTLSKYWNGDYRLYQEPVFIPRHLDSAEGDGYLVALTMNYAEMISELVILDTKDISKHVAVCRLALPLRMGIHGNWVDDTDIDGHAQASTAGKA